MHPLNPYLSKKPDFAHLATLHPDFAPFVKASDSGYASIDFQDAAALRALTTVLLKEDWGYEVELRDDRLCPTIANRLDYLYHILDIEPYLPDSISISSRSPKRPLKVLDVGTGHIAIYPLLLHSLRPTAQFTGTELDAVSFHHSVKTRQANNIPSSAISLLRPTVDQPILFPIFDILNQRLQVKGIDTDCKDASYQDKDSSNGKVVMEGDGWDFVICNPPFFASEQEMKLGIDKKIEGAPAAPTAAANELITLGGEVAFVGQMITESLKLQETCTWYTSLIGKYSSLMTLVERLRQDKIDNYSIKTVKQSRTTRWILGWSFSRVRLPDVITRPEVVHPGTSFTRLLPPPNTFTHRDRANMLPASAYRRIISEVLGEVHLYPSPSGSVSDSTGTSERDEIDSSSTEPILIAPKRNTWSRSARRQAARQKVEVDSGDQGIAGIADTRTPPLFRAEFRFFDDPTPISPALETAGGEEVARPSREFADDPSSPTQQSPRDHLRVPGDEAGQPDSAAGGSKKEDDEGDESVPGTQEDVSTSPSGRVELHWLEGRDRALVEALWKFILSKADFGKGYT